jgi:hypothetical protein
MFDALLERFSERNFYVSCESASVKSQTDLFAVLPGKCNANPAPDTLSRIELDTITRQNITLRIGSATIGTTNIGTVKTMPICFVLCCVFEQSALFASLSAGSAMFHVVAQQQFESRLPHRPDFFGFALDVHSFFNGSGT